MQVTPECVHSADRLLNQQTKAVANPDFSHQQSDETLGWTTLGVWHVSARWIESHHPTIPSFWGYALAGPTPESQIRGPCVHTSLEELTCSSRASLFRRLHNILTVQNTVLMWSAWWSRFALAGPVPAL
jgi:hypothetical protein